MLIYVMFHSVQRERTSTQDLSNFKISNFFFRRSECKQNDTFNFKRWANFFWMYNTYDSTMHWAYFGLIHCSIFVYVFIYLSLARLYSLWGLEHTEGRANGLTPKFDRVPHPRRWRLFEFAPNFQTFYPKQGLSSAQI